MPRYAADPRMLVHTGDAAVDVESCTMPEYQLLGAIAWASTRAHGALPQDSWWHARQPERPVPLAAVLRLFAPEDRDAAEALLSGLAERELLSRRRDTVAVPTHVHLATAQAIRLGRPAAELLRRYFNAAEVHHVAAGLGFAKAPNRDAAERDIVRVLTDPALLKDLLATAPEAATDLLEQLSHGGPWVRAACFATSAPYSNAKYMFDPRGSGSAAADWLAARGLLLPAGDPGLAELPQEIALVMRGDRVARLDPHPPAPPSDLPTVVRVRESAQAAATSMVSHIERLLAACADTPLTLRKSGGVAVRDAKRVAKEIGATDEVTRLYIDLAHVADLLGGLADPVDKPRGRRPAPDPTIRIVPTTAYDSWLEHAPGDRLAPLLIAWATLPDAPTWWPDPDETRVALAGAHHPAITDLRLAVLEALATIPEGHGVDEHTLPYLLSSIVWHRPLLTLPGELTELLQAMLLEADLLGVTAHGALTSVGFALLDLLRSGVPYPQALQRHDPALAKVLAGLLPPPQTIARFQADLTAVVAGAPEAALTELLNTAAVRESEGHAVVWRFSATSVRHALDAGRDPEDLINALTQVAQGELPQPLSYLIKDVGRTHGRMRVVRSGCCIRSEDEALLTELAAARSLRKLGLRRIAPTVLISSSPERETLDALRAAGYTPALEAETGATIVEKPEQRRAPARFSKQ